MRGAVIVGASLAGLRTAEVLRKNGFKERVTLLGMETHLPYDRPPLSKGILTGTVDDEQILLRTKDHFDELEIELHTGVRATALDVPQKVVHTTAGEFPYDQLVIATGAAARTLPGTDGLVGVHAMRTLEDALAIRAEFRNRPKVVIVGAGFIGSEVAASARAADLDVTIVEALANPLARSVGVEVGEMCAALHAEGGTDLLCGIGVASLAGETRVEAVHLTDGITIPADLVIVGIGVTPSIDWLTGSGLDLSDGVACDQYLRAGPEGVFAAGDVASWFNPFFGEAMRVEHWTNAAEQALAVARNIINPTDPQPYAGIPYFWSDQYGHRIQFAGRPKADEVVIVEGTRETGKPVALYRKDDVLCGALAIDNPMILMQLRTRLMAPDSWAAAFTIARPDA